ncbi:hypothetical protein BGX34_004541 [Mortierella sp. NVP85]|nr:hypothetical protein BGX34_004541 [Mortierella sp. NVP85]
MSTVARRLEEAHEHLLKLYTSIPVLTPCLEKIKTNQAEFVAINSRLRLLQDDIAAGQNKTEKAKRQLDSVFTINKADCEKAYRREANELKAFEDERRASLRQRDSIVTERYRLQKERDTLLEETRQLKRLTESVFDRSKDEVANTDFPEELHWQLELKDFDFRITEVKQQVMKYNTALSNLSRAANLSEAALMAFMGYPDAAFKVWRVEYALEASRKMRVYLRVELSLSNAYTNEAAARDACPNIMPPLATPVKPSAVQAYFEPTRGRPQPFDAEPQLRGYIAQLRSAHRTAEALLAQETERLSAMQAYRESIIPLLAKIRRHVFQNSCLGGHQIEGWEDEQGQSLLGTEADILVRGGIHEVGIPDINRLSSLGSSSRTVPTMRRTSVDMADRTDDPRRNRRGNALAVPNTDEQETSTDPTRSATADGVRVVTSAGNAPLSTLAPSNVLGSEVLMQVDRARQAKMEGKRKFKHKFRSRSCSAHDDVSGPDSGTEDRPSQGSGDNNGNADSAQGSHEGRRLSTMRLFGFSRSRRERSCGPEDAVVPTTPRPRIFQMSGRDYRSSVDVTDSSSHGILDRGSRDNRQGHRRNVPSISVWNHGDASGRPRMISMDDYIGIGPVAERSDRPAGEHEPSQGSVPLVPSYEEHQQHVAIDPEQLRMFTASRSYEELPSLAEEDSPSYTMPDVQPDQPTARTVPFRPHSIQLSSVMNNQHAGSSVTTPLYQQHHYSFSDQTPEGNTWGQGIHPPEYGMRPPAYVA